jgi:sulfite reductase alpha subunit
MTMADLGSNGTPLLDELEKGPWPSFVTEIKQTAGFSKPAEQLLALLERSYRERIGHWKHGGIVGVMGYGGGVIGRYNDLPEEYPDQHAYRLVLHVRGVENDL